MLTFGEMVIPSASYLCDSRLPSVFPQRNVQTAKKRDLDEDDELFWDLGGIPNIMPYPLKNRYDRALKDKTYQTAVLENDCLRATFLPEMGGKLWSLYDKKAGRELLYVNDCIRPCNLALRNAWTSGGVEWNIGMIGHTPFTCEKLSMAVVEAEDGTPVLRFYAFERIREVVYQMDFLLPEHCPALLCRMRIKNLHHHTIPMYWFSNIAAPDVPGSRAIVHASSAYVSDIRGIGKTAVPMNSAGADVTYAESSPAATDYFFHIPDRARKYIAYVDPTGKGLYQTSTARMKGRKLFVWGTRTGGQNWQKWLTRNAGDYVEIQAGVNRTQYECIPMPPDAAWEWMEAYGPMSIPAEAAHGDYTAAQSAVEAAIEAQISEEWLETFLRESKRSIALRPGRLMHLGDDAAWAALEKLRRAKAGEADFEPHLDFGATGPQQEPWVRLLRGESMPLPAADACTYQITPPWHALLQHAQGDYAAYQLAMIEWYNGHMDRAEAGLLPLADKFAPAAYALGVLYYLAGNARAAKWLGKAAEAMHCWVEFGRDYLQALCDLGLYEEALQALDRLDDTVQQDGHVQYCRAVALAHLGHLDEAEAMLLGDKSLVMDDLREGVTPLSDLWLYIHRCRTGEDGSGMLPPQLDYTMA